jgi:outer membrane protein assembly factor BamB
MSIERAWHRGAVSVVAGAVWLAAAQAPAAGAIAFAESGAAIHRTAVVSATHPGALTTSAGSLPVYVGYAEGRASSPALPSPWNGSPNVTFVGRTTKFDDGAIRVDNPSATAATVSDVSVTVGPYAFDIWGTGLTVPANGSLILTGTSATGFNFDTSRTPNANCTNTGYLPSVAITVDGSTQTLIDTAQVLNTGGIDPASCGLGNESEPWQAIGGPSPVSTDWPSFHHDPTHAGVASDFTIGASSAPGLSLKWATVVGGGGSKPPPINSSPAVVHNAALGKDLVYVASGARPAAVDAIDAATGQIVWTYSVPGAGIWSSPAVAGNTVYIGGKDHKLYALDATTGQFQCSYDTGGVLLASPMVARIDGTGFVVFEGDAGVSDKLSAGHEWAINGVGNTAGDCTLRWSFNGFLNRGVNNTRVGTYSSPAIGTDSTGRPLVIFGSTNPDDGVYALDARDGTQVWRFQAQITAGDEDVGAAPTISAPGVNGFADGVVYVNGKNLIEYALDLLTGAKIWQFDMGADSGVLTANSQGATALVAKRVVVSYANYVYELSATTGARQWRSPATAAQTLSSIAVSGMRGDQVVFIGDLAGGEYGFALSTGALLYQFNVGGGAMILSSAAVSAGKVFFGASDGHLYALG